MTDPQISLQLGDFAFEPATRTLRNAKGEVVPLAQKPYTVLLFLVMNRQRMVTRGELLEQFWAGREVYDEALTRCMSSIRKALDDQGDPPKYIETRRADGYRYIGPCAEIAVTEAPPMLSAAAPASTAPPAPAGATTATLAPSPWLLLATLVGIVWGGVMLLRWYDSNKASDLGGLRRVAVVTMINTTDPAEDWLARTLTARAIGGLSRIDGLEVAQRGPGPDEATVRLELLLEPKGLRLEAELLRPGEDDPVWRFEQHYSRSEIMKAEREWVRHLSRDGDLRMREIPPRVRSELAYVHLLRGLYLSARGDAAALAEALDEFRGTLDEDPGIADAYGGIAEVEMMRATLAPRSDLAALARARAAAETALHLDPDSARAHLVLGALVQLDWDWASADAHFDRALTIDINDAEARRARSLSLCYRRRISECLDGLRRAQAQDPASPAVVLALGNALRWAGEHQAAVAVLENAAKRWPGEPALGLALADAQAAAGAGDTALLRYESLLEPLGLARVGGPLAHAYGQVGRRLDASALAARLRSTPEQTSPVTLALALVGVGDLSGALAALEAAAGAKDRLALTIAVDGRFDPLRGLPRYQALLARLGLAGPAR